MIIRHNPWDIVGELNKILENNVKSSLASDDSRVESSRWMPAVDIKEEADQFKLYVDIPGVNPDEIDVSMENNILTIKGEREETKREEKPNYHRIERMKGMFYRRFTLPDSADAEQIEAKAKRGVLEINIGKKKIAQSRKIKIESDE